MGILEELFISPELYPLKIDFRSRVVVFVRMTRRAYDAVLFASFRGASRFGGEAYEIRLDDVLLACRNAATLKRTHYILHTAYCCSTLLARYFELLPSCFVLSEPPLLAQVATTTELPGNRWQEVLDLAVRLLTRTFAPNDIPVIKTHVPCNVIGGQLLVHNPEASVTFLFTPLRSFLLAVLKSPTRQQRIRIWNRQLAPVAPICPELADVALDQLSPSQSAAYWWLLTRSLCQQLSSGPFANRVSVVNGEELAASPESILRHLISSSGVSVDESQLREILMHPSLRTHSKHPSQEFDAESLREELTTLEDRFGQEADQAIDWVSSKGLDCAFPASTTLRI